ncbi:hypothetical protein [Psychrobacter sp. WY6]|uniref:hypothetical protein n=1 Tax=Psychrobacter sp. WY6 TaxID=2708350 RepID=UPI002022E1B1|nr:hypothetical protein [Psychrobacter sp. WY6]
MPYNVSSLYGFLPKSLASHLYSRTLITTPAIAAMMISSAAVADSADIPAADTNFYFYPQATGLLDSHITQSDAQIEWSVMATAHSPTQPISEFLDDCSFGFRRSCLCPRSDVA